MRRIVLLAHNLRSAHNVGSLLRTADGIGVSEVYLTGYTPYPIINNDNRLPHESKKVHQKIAKTALGAENNRFIKHSSDITKVIKKLKKDGYQVVALEQSPTSIKLNDFKPAKKIAIVIGRETEGIEPDILEVCDLVVEIPMFGDKESYNVVQAAAMAMYHLRFT